MKNMERSGRASTILIVLGALFLLYAFLGNYLALPGYIRFLERGRTSAAGNTMDFDVLVGAIKTIVWLFSFQIGMFLVLIGGLVAMSAKRRYIVSSAGGGVVWLGIAGIPSIPGPFRIFYAVSGLIVLLLIVAVIAFWTKRNTLSKARLPLSAYAKAVGYVFFALASWDVCGLGTMGRILHIETAYESGTGPLIVTQMTKIMFEFLSAWGFTAYAHYAEFRQTEAVRRAAGISNRRGD